MTRYTVGSNLPGYMPDSDPYAVDDRETAIECLVADIEAMYDDDGDVDERDMLEAIAYVRECTDVDIQVRLNDRIFWATPAH
jgi:hypothetical protein